MEDATPPTDVPTPESTARRPDPIGTEVTLADGRVWALADHVPAFAAVWDRLYDGNIVFRQYETRDVHLAASRLLLENYDLDAESVAWLLAGADPDALVVAIEGALFGVKNELRGWTDWAEGALWANGIDPAKLPPRMLRPVLNHLVAAGRALPHLDFTSAGQAAAKRAQILEFNDQIDAARQDFGGGKATTPPIATTDAPPAG